MKLSSIFHMFIGLLSSLFVVRTSFKAKKYLSVRCLVIIWCRIVAVASGWRSETSPPFLFLNSVHHFSEGAPFLYETHLFLASAPAARKKFRLLKPTPISARSVALLRSCFSSSAVRTGVFPLTAPSSTLSVTWSCNVDFGTLYFLLAFNLVQSRCHALWWPPTSFRRIHL